MAYLHDGDDDGFGLMLVWYGFEDRDSDILLSQAIKYLHERGIVHRDLKPENIMMKSITSDDDIKIGDFGLSKFTAPEEIMKLPCGTLAYVAPEVLQMKGYSKEVDLWSIGVILFVLIRGKLPFDSKVHQCHSCHCHYNINCHPIVFTMLSPLAPRIQAHHLQREERWL